MTREFSEEVTVRLGARSLGVAEGASEGDVLSFDGNGDLGVSTPSGSLPDPITDPVTIATPEDEVNPALLIDPASTDNNSLIVKVDGGAVYTIGPGQIYTTIPTEDGNWLLSDYTNGNPLVQAVDPGKIGFFGATPVAKQNVPLTTPDVQDVIDALVALGLVEQSD